MEPNETEIGRDLFNHSAHPWERDDRVRRALAVALDPRVPAALDTRQALARLALGMERSGAGVVAGRGSVGIGISADVRLASGVRRDFPARFSPETLRGWVGYATIAACGILSFISWQEIGVESTNRAK